MEGGGSGRPGFRSRILELKFWNVGGGVAGRPKRLKSGNLNASGMMPPSIQRIITMTDMVAGSVMSERWEHLCAQHAFVLRLLGL